LILFSKFIILGLDHDRIQFQLQELSDLKVQQKAAENEGFIDVAHIDRIIDEIDFSDLDQQKNLSEIDTSIDNDFWEDFNMEADSEVGQRPTLNVKRAKSDDSKSVISKSIKRSSYIQHRSSLISKR